MELSKRLAMDAKKKGICKQWHDELEKMTSKEAMLEMYLKGIDFCLSNDYPTNDFIRENFKGQGMEEHGIHLDEEIIVENVPKCVCLGDTKGIVKTTKYGVCEVFAKHDSALNIIAQDNAFVMVDVFDDAVVHIHASGDSKVCVNHYGGTVDNCAIEQARIKFREMNKKTY